LACAFAGCATTNGPSAAAEQQITTTKPSKKSKKTSHEYVRQNVKFVEDKHIGARSATAPEIKYLDPNRNKWTDGFVFYKLIGIDVGRSGVQTVITQMSRSVCIKPQQGNGLPIIPPIAMVTSSVLQKLTAVQPLIYVPV